MENFFQTDKNNNKPTYYDLLGCHQSSSTEQIACEYKIRALVCHPDKNGNNSKSNEQFQLLVKAKETLTDPKKKKLYDNWLNGMNMGMSWDDWYAFATKTKPVFHWVFKKTNSAITENNEINEVPQANSSGTQNNLNMFRGTKDTTLSNDVLSRFRNYDI